MKNPQESECQSILTKRRPPDGKQLSAQLEAEYLSLLKKCHESAAKGLADLEALLTLSRNTFAAWQLQLATEEKWKAR